MSPFLRNSNLDIWTGILSCYTGLTGLTVKVNKNFRCNSVLKNKLSKFLIQQSAHRIPKIICISGSNEPMEHMMAELEMCT